MKTFIVSVLFLLSIISGNAQTCEEYLEYVKSNGYGTTYNSYSSTAISKVTFYTMSIDYRTYYFAVVCFKVKYSYNCNEYIYQVGLNTQSQYARKYLNSAGKAFWEYIQPYNDVLGCAPDLE